MIRVEKSTVIQRAPGEVFDFVADQTNAIRWQSGIAEVRRLTEGPPGVGTRHAFVRDSTVRSHLEHIMFFRELGDKGEVIGWAAKFVGAGSRLPVRIGRMADFMFSGRDFMREGFQSAGPGSYRSDFITYTVPAGWSAYGGFAALTNDSHPPNGMAIVPDRGIAVVYKDPCHWASTSAPVGPTVDALVAALVAQKRGATVTPTDVTIKGFKGKQIDLMVPLAEKIASCDGGEYHSWGDGHGGDRYNQGPGQHDLLDILDVNGTTLVIDRVFYPANTSADLTELQAIFDSIKITP